MNLYLRSNFLPDAYRVFGLKGKGFLGENIDNDVGIEIAIEIENLHVSILDPVVTQFGIGKIEELHGIARTVTK